MSTITALRTGKQDKKRVNLFLDGKFAFSLETDKVAREGLRVGLELTGDRLDALLGSLKLSRCLDAAYRYLSYRPRSEAELRERLGRRGFPAEHISAALDKLKEQGLLDDAAFARFWAENRATFRPRSRAITRRELHQKGVPEEVIREAVSEIDEVESAYRAALSKVRRFSQFEYPEFRQRLGEFLRRRGFNYDIINRTIKKVWEERKE
ncbi:MAG: regulatory protein RecX, partial [Dehalococcoidia bacterium]|nr:regulatory protein RecX [Dehalococcoidia bacterium]